MKFSVYFDIFISFFKIGCFSFGGGYAMILMMQKEISEKRGWITEEEFLDYLSIAQSSPGPMAINAAILIGYSQKRFWGGMVGFLGAVLPSFIILLTVAIFFKNIYHLEPVKRIFLGIRPAVVALILYPVFQFSKNITRKEYPLLIVVAIGIYFGLSPIVFILLALIYGILYTYYIKKKEINK